MSPPKDGATRNPDRPRIIIGFARSGTTWLQDALAEANHLRPVFEPLHPEHVPGAYQYAHKYLSPTDDAEHLRELLDPFVFGNFSPVWADYRIVTKHVIPSPSSFASWEKLKDYVRNLKRARDNVLRYHPQRKCLGRLIKFVRANMLLSWLKSNYDARIIFIIRHPAAVVLSQMAARTVWDPMQRIERYREDQPLLERIPDPLRVLVFSALEDVEAYTLSWCIENVVGLAQAKESGVHVVYYEKLLAEPDVEWPLITAALGLNVVPDGCLIRRPSQQAWGRKAEDANLIRRYATWLKLIDPSVAARIQSILDAAAIGVYSTNSAEPKIDCLQVSREQSSD